MDQVELDAAYDQAFYAPLRLEVINRLASTSEAVRSRIGQPMRESYGPTAVEKLDIYRTKRAKCRSQTYSITSLAATCNVSGTVRPSAFAALRLITSSNLVGSRNGRSAGRVPLSTLAV
jgi:hypothetical protein